jgi:hypothetical protein
MYALRRTCQAFLEVPGTLEAVQLRDLCYEISPFVPFRAFRVLRLS